VNTTTPTPIATGDQVLTPRGLERVAHVKHNEIGTGQFIVFCGSVTACAPAALELPVLTWSKDPHAAAFEGVTLHAGKTRHGWEVVARVEGERVLSSSGKTLAAVKAAAPRVAAVAAWHAAGNAWSVPTPETDPEEIKNRERAAQWEAQQAEESALSEQLGTSPARTVPVLTADAVARAVRSALKASNLLGKDWNCHLPTVEHTRDGKYGAGRVKVDPARESFVDIADVIRAGVSAELLAARAVVVDVFNGDLMSDYFSTVGLRVWPKDPEVLRAAVLSGELHPELNGDKTRAISWFAVADTLPAEWTALAKAMSCSRNRPALLVTAFRALVAQLERLTPSDRAAVAPLLAGLARDWSGEWSELFPAVMAIAETTPAQELPTAEPAPVEVLEDSATEEDAPAPAETEEDNATPEWPEAMREYLGRLIYAPKREHAEAVGRSLLTGATLPECSAAWAEDVERKVRRHVRELVSA
jgi:hypothetical protein